MEEEGGSLGKLSKKLAEKAVEVDYKTKAGTAWSHSYLNQKPWHPLSYPNQRRKWIAEQTNANRQRRADEIAREFSQEQEFFRQTALVSKKEKEKVETMKAVSFMYVRPPGYNAESAKAAEIADERKRLEQDNTPQDSTAGAPPAMPPETMQGKDRSNQDRKKPRPKDVFGRALPTEEEFEVLKNAPRLETGLPARVKPFGVEVRNVKCVRCGTYGHQSGDRECPLKDAIMPNDESRIKREDPLTAIMAHTDPSEPLKWELKQKPGLSPPRGGFKPDDPNQQIVAEDIFDEYGGFLSGGNIPELFTNFSIITPLTLIGIIEAANTIALVQVCLRALILIGITEEPSDTIIVIVFVVVVIVIIIIVIVLILHQDLIRGSSAENSTKTFRSGLEYMTTLAAKF
ncbi:hypothetical protein NE237_026944 [Protea cynaroides]|uniref:CBF1-interacting co-repressor CIR N-terminal domain-containing protein n=1 Tax=Protea cynaroides TaxID=273540 RepID=A0A9Q0GQA5_9MAGN|nr:hypothetical protein NE237_026944 [Protea cynaroides]